MEELMLFMAQALRDQKQQSKNSKKEEKVNTNFKFRVDLILSMYK